MLGGNVRGGQWVAAVVLMAMSWPALHGIPSRSLTLMSPGGHSTTWWGPATAAAGTPGTATRTTGRRKASHSVCGNSITRSSRGYNITGPSHSVVHVMYNRVRRRRVTVWPYSVTLNHSVDFTTIERGAPNTNSYRMYYEKDGVPISPFHDIPLFASEENKIFNMVVEAPRWTTAKMEIDTKSLLNPIKQDVRQGKLRYVANIFPYHGYMWNYGALPQTWEDPNHPDDETGCKGDNDPIDVCEIGYRVAKQGEVLQVKVLGAIALIDEGETDWKLIAIDINDPLAPKLRNIKDVEKHMPGLLEATVEWFTIYKVPDGKPENQFAFDGEPQDRKLAHRVIMGTHGSWQRLVEGRSDADGLQISSVTVAKALKKVSIEEAKKVVMSSPEPGPARPIDPKVDLWHYIESMNPSSSESRV